MGTKADKDPSPRILARGEAIYQEQPGGPRFGDRVWDFRAVIKRASISEGRIDLGSVAPAYRDSVEDILIVLARPTHPAVVRAGIIRKDRPIALSAIFSKFGTLRIISHWGLAHGLTSFSQWTQADADNFLADVKTGKHRGSSSVGAATSSAGISRYVVTLKQIREFGVVIAGGGFGFVPWRSLPAEDIGSKELPVKRGNSTPVLGWDTWAPLVAGAWRITDHYSSDILRAAEVVENLSDGQSGPCGREGWNILSKWATAGGRVPLHTGFGRSPGLRGEPNRTFLCRKIGINQNLFGGLQYQWGRDALDFVNEVASDPSRSEMGGLITPTAQVQDADGSQAPWIEEIGLGETEYLLSVLRASCYVLLGALTGMRDSEIQELTKASITIQDGLPALDSRQYKGFSSETGTRRSWWAPAPVVRAAEVLGKLSRNPTHLLARSATNVGNYDASRDIPRLISFINDAPASRAGRGRGLGLKPIDTTKNLPINSRTLRESFCVYAVTNPEAEIGLGIQLGHAAWRTTAGYVVDGQQEATRLIAGHRIAIARSQAEELITGQGLIAGAPAGRILDFRAQVIADPKRGERIMASVAEKLYLGIANDCMFNPDTAACGADGPHLGDHLCTGPDCGNALFGEAHAELLKRSLERFDAFLGTAKESNKLVARMRKDRAQVAALYRQLTTAEEGGR